MAKKIRNKILTVVNGKVYESNAHLDEKGEVLSYWQMKNKLEDMARKVQNAGGTPSVETLAAMQALATASVEVMDDAPVAVTDSFIRAIETDLPNAKTTELVKIREFLDPIAPIQEIKGDGDRVPLMRKVEVPDDLEIKLYGVGNTVTIKEELANPFFSADRVLRSARRWHAQVKDRPFFKALTDISYGAKNLVAADTTGATHRDKLYNSLLGAKKKLYALDYVLTGQKVGNKMGRNVVFCSPIVAEMLREIDIHLDTRPVAGALGLDIIEWAGADGYIYGNEVLAGLYLPDDYAYVARIPASQEGLCKVVGADLEYRSGEGSALAGSSKEEAWFSYFGYFTKYFLPTSNGNGCVVKVGIP